MPLPCCVKGKLPNLFESTSQTDRHLLQPPALTSPRKPAAFTWTECAKLKSKSMEHSATTLEISPMKFRTPCMNLPSIWSSSLTSCFHQRDVHSPKLQTRRCGLQDPQLTHILSHPLPPNLFFPGKPAVFTWTVGAKLKNKSVEHSRSSS
jgi:hypothetical protein